MKKIDSNHRAFNNYKKIFRFDFCCSADHHDYSDIQVLLDELSSIEHNLHSTTGHWHTSDIKKNRSNGRHYLARISDRFGKIKMFIWFSKK